MHFRIARIRPEEPSGRPPAMGRQCKDKVCFSSRRQAEDALLQARIKRALFASTRRRECRSYYCSICGSWHLTSKPHHGEKAS